MRRHGCWWRRRATNVAALLDQAAVRFDFSQYTDTAAMVDVNGGYGPLAFTKSANTTAAFDAVGLRLVRSGGLRVGFAAQTEEVASPVIAGPDGFSLLCVVRINTPTGFPVSAINVAIAADPQDTFAPGPFAQYRMALSTAPEPGNRFDFCRVNMTDTGGATIVDNAPFQDAPLDVATPDAYTGLLVGCFVFDVPNSEVRFKTATEVEVTGDETMPFDIAVPAFAAAPVVLDTLQISGEFGSDATIVEYLLANRAYTVTEVDALIAHFLPEPPDPLGLLDEAAVRFDFSRYSDVDDMVDVNGGWGPLTAGVTGGTAALTADGLHLLLDDSDSVADLAVQGAGPILFASTGLTLMSVIDVDDLGAGTTRIMYCDAACRIADDFSPELYCTWHRDGVGPDSFDLLLTDVGGSQDRLVIALDDDSPGFVTPPDSTGRFMLVVVVNVADETVSINLRSPTDQFRADLPLLKPTADYVSEDPLLAAESLSVNSGSHTPSDSTRISDLIWNRALSVAEVDALIAHFLA